MHPIGVTGDRKSKPWRKINSIHIPTRGWKKINRVETGMGREGNEQGYFEQKRSREISGEGYHCRSCEKNRGDNRSLGHIARSWGKEKLFKSRKQNLLMAPDKGKRTVNKAC